MKILFISPYWKEEHRWMVSSVKLAELWQRLGHEVVAVCMGSETGVEKVSDTLTIHRRKDLFIPDPFNYGIAFGFAGYVRKLAKQEKPDLIIINKVLYWSSLSIIPLRLTGHRVLLLTDVLGGMTWWPRTIISKIAMAISAWTTGWLTLLCANKIVTFHPQPPKLLKFLGISKKAEVIPTGIDASSFTTSRSHDSRPHDSTITYVGRLESIKGVDDFLAAVVPLKKDYPDIKIQVVGWYPSTSSGQVKHPLVLQYRDEVEFTGLRHDIPAILSKSDIFVMPSHSEGLSNAIMEAMSSGCACVVTDVGGNRFLIDKNGITGFRYPAGDRAALQSSVRKLIEDPAKRKTMGEAALKRIHEHFDWSVVGKMYERLFSELIIKN